MFPLNGFFKDIIVANISIFLQTNKFQYKHFILEFTFVIIKTHIKVNPFNSINIQVVKCLSFVDDFFCAFVSFSKGMISPPLCPPQFHLCFLLYHQNYVHIWLCCNISSLTSKIILLFDNISLLFHPIFSQASQ